MHPTKVTSRSHGTLPRLANHSLEFLHVGRVHWRTHQLNGREGCALLVALITLHVDGQSLHVLEFDKLQLDALAQLLSSQLKLLLVRVS